MIIQESTSYKVQVKNILNKMKGVKKWRYDFMLEVFRLILSIKGRINFLQLDRFGNHGEQHYRNQFESQFDFMSFNKALIDEHAGNLLPLLLIPVISINLENPPMELIGIGLVVLEKLNGV